MDVTAVASVATALADSTRLTVFRLCDGSLAVGEIAARAGVTSAAVSYHLAILERAGLVVVVGHGRRHIPTRVADAWRLLVRALRWADAG
jgi:DNA-binding transcriptional ArsR family regulator